LYNPAASLFWKKEGGREFSLCDFLIDGIIWLVLEELAFFSVVHVCEIELHWVLPSQV